MEKNPTLHATVPKAVSQKREVWDAETFFSHLMFAMMPIWSWLSTRPLHAVCESLKFLVWHGTVSIFLRKASQPERHPSWLKKSSSVSTRRPWSLLSKKMSSSSTRRARSATRACSFWKSPRPNRAFAGFLFRRPLPTSLRHGSASRSTPRRLSVGECTDYNPILANGLGRPMERTRITALLNAWKSPWFTRNSCFRHQSVAAEENLREPGPVKNSERDSQQSLITLPSKRAPVIKCSLFICWSLWYV